MEIFEIRQPIFQIYGKKKNFPPAKQGLGRFENTLERSNLA